MKVKQLFLLFALLATTQLTAQGTFEITDSKVTIYGSSNVHDWESEVTDVKAKGAIALENGAIAAIKNLTVEMMVESIESSKGSIMDKKTYNALNSSKYPKITYQLTEVKSIQKSGNAYTINARGNLSIAGTTKPIDLNVTGQVLGNGTVQFTGSKAMKMTTFNVDPPTAMLGAMKTYDDLTIKFSVTLAEKDIR